MADLTDTIQLGTSKFRSAGRTSPGESSFTRCDVNDFKPKSSTGGNAETYMAIGSNGDVQVAVPSEHGDALTLYKGSQKPVKNEKECLLIFDPKTKTLRLEKLNTHIVLKKTRDNDPEVESAFKADIDKLRQLRSLPKEVDAEDDLRMSPEPEDREPASAASQLHLSTSDDSSSSSDSNDSSDDEDSDSERLMDEMEKLKANPEPVMPVQQQPQQQQQTIQEPDQMSSGDESMSESDDDDDLEGMMEKELNMNRGSPNDPPPPEESMPDFDELLGGSPPQQQSRPPTVSPALSSPSPPQQPDANLLQNDLCLSESSDED
ncbi:hypothetical protein L596_008422 [Steinernema carpocapsae]|uniref:Ell-associated factor Eaf n=1 Tax=Steinernema carpocapsae TaxID=34508 RepID=A0A4U5PCG0_STECR|nr:hypothetical protein L596_008422 [Steinernema carpocapsae]